MTAAGVTGGAGASDGDVAVVDRLAVTWRVGPEDADRPDRLVALLLDGALEDALDAAGVGRHEEVCLRRVAVPALRGRSADADTGLVQAWSRSIGAAVAAAAAPGGDAVRYRSRQVAVVDLVVRAVAGDVDRAWAWRQLGLWPAAAGAGPGGGTAPAVVARPAEVAAEVLADHPRLTPPALAALAAAGRLGAVLAAWGPERVVALAAAAGAPAVPSPAAPAAAAAPPPGAPAGPAAAVVARSRLFGPLAASGTVARWLAGPGAAPVATALAGLVVLEAEPAAVAASQGAGVVAAVAAALAAAVAAGPAGITAAPPGAVAAVPAPPGPPLPAGPAAAAPPAADRPTVGVVADDGPAAGGPAPAAEPVVARTAWGGLLFLLHLVEETGLPTRAAAGPAIAAAGLRAVLHGMALALLPAGEVDARDPAVLAFCGSAPGDEPPAPLDGPAVAAAEAEAEAVVDLLRARLAGTDLGGDTLDDGALVAAVCRRRAVVEADPGWLDVVLEVDEVSTAVRRAGLDLDPGWLPWLGCVVRFRYA